MDFWAPKCLVTVKYKLLNSPTNLSKTQEHCEQAVGGSHDCRKHHNLHTQHTGTLKCEMVKIKTQPRTSLSENTSITNRLRCETINTQERGVLVLKHRKHNTLCLNISIIM